VPDLRGHVKGRAAPLAETRGRIPRLVISSVLRNAKITEHNMQMIPLRGRCKQHILWLQVFVNDPTFVCVSHRVEHLPSDLSRPALLEVRGPRRIQLNCLPEITTENRLHGYVHRVVVLERLEDPDDVRVVELRQELELPHQLCGTHVL